MHISPIDIAVIVIYLAAVLGVGLYQALKIRTSGDYYAGGRKFNKFYLMMHALGTASHADEPVSVIGCPTGDEAGAPLMVTVAVVEPVGAAPEGEADAANVWLARAKAPCSSRLPLGRVDSCRILPI